jgi:hypothetical protein
MLDDDDCVMSDIPAVNGPMLHTASQCREYVYAAMTSYKRDRASIARYLHHVASVEIGSLIGIFGPKAAEVVETVACWVDNRLDEKWADKMRERERAAADRRTDARKLKSFDRNGRYLAVSVRRDVMVRFDKVLRRIERTTGLELSRSDALNMVLREYERSLADGRLDPFLYPPEVKAARGKRRTTRQ